MWGGFLIHTDTELCVSDTWFENNVSVTLQLYYKKSQTLIKNYSDEYYGRMKIGNKLIHAEWQRKLELIV